MLLSVHDRLMLLSLLPREGNFTNLKLLRKAREALSFNETENKALNVREEGEGAERRMIWNNFVIVEKDTGRPFVPPFSLGDQSMIAANEGNYETRPAVEDKDIGLGEVVTQLIVKALKDLDEKNKMTADHLNIYEKFMTKGD